MISVLLEPLSYDFMLRALAVAVIASIVCALLSCWLVLIGWSLMGDAVSHAVLPGVVLAYIFGLPFSVGAVIFGFIAVGLIGFVKRSPKVKEDAAIGIVFTTLFALGLVLISKTPSQTNLTHIIFGNVLGVSNSELIQVAIIASLVLLILIAKRRDFTLFAFDKIHAHAIGLSTLLLGGVLLSLLALTVVVALQVVGVILVVAMLIIPGVSARLLTNRFSYMLVIAPVISVLCTITGVWISYFADTAVGGMIVLMQGLVFIVVYALNTLRARGKSRRKRKAALTNKDSILSPASV
ncbi:metal ABC transporter permease [Actinomycetaceae bacterium TAE3-ERU4]|nr:metal ABC transporter permease [Actinomycetaceae bacterium TAE3-ERU4]